MLWKCYVPSQTFCCFQVKPFVVISWYRPESEIKLFDHFQSILKKNEAENKDVVVIGDVNCDLLTDNLYERNN